MTAVRFHPTPKGNPLKRAWDFPLTVFKMSGTKIVTASNPNRIAFSMVAGVCLPATIVCTPAAFAFVTSISIIFTTEKALDKIRDNRRYSNCFPCGSNDKYDTAFLPKSSRQERKTPQKVHGKSDTGLHLS